MIYDPSLSLSNAIFLSAIASIGVILYAGFAYLVVRSKNTEVKRRWRYSILCGVSFGVILAILFGIISILVLFVDVGNLGFMALIKHPRNSSDLFTGIVLYLVYSVLINLPVVSFVTFGTYWNEIQCGDMFINRLLYPVKKHPSDGSPDGVFDKMRTFIAKLID